MNFFYILHDPKDLIVYTHAKKSSELLYHINLYLSQDVKETQVTLIYSLEQEEESDVIINNKFINIYKCSLNFEETFLLHNFKKDRLKGKFIYKEKFIELYDAIALTPEQVSEGQRQINRTPSGILTTVLNDVRNKLFKEYQHTYESGFELDVQDFINWLKVHISHVTTFNFKEFFANYSITYHTRLIDPSLYKTVIFENVYYKNKNFFKKDGTFFDISSIKNDIEYKNYNNSLLSIDVNNSINIYTSVLFMDYIYDMYNFGEFWDVVIRMLYLDSKEHLDMYGLKENRIFDIEQYFNKFGFSFPPKYCRDYKTDDTNGSTLFFKKLYLSTISNVCRGSLDCWIAHNINKIFNESPTIDNEYKIYLSRGKWLRGIVNEELIITKLKERNYIIIDGSESSEQQKFYFTNASLIVGVHGSLMKNIVWCKKSPIFIELFPVSRASFCFIGNALKLQLNTVAIPCKSIANEIINLTDQEIDKLIQLLDILSN